MQDNPIEVEVNGVKYREIIRKKVKIPNKMKPYLMMGANYGMSTEPFIKKEVTDSELIHIAKEFELVQQKKSNQSKNTRDSIIYQFDYFFQKI